MCQMCCNSLHYRPHVNTFYTSSADHLTNLILRQPGSGAILFWNLSDRNIDKLFPSCKCKQTDQWFIGKRLFSMHSFPRMLCFSFVVLWCSMLKDGLVLRGPPDLEEGGSEPPGPILHPRTRYRAQ